MSATFYIGDVLETMAKLPAGSVDLILTSPPFLALRSYLPADHPDKAKEGGSQSTPGEFIDWLIDFAEASARVLAPHGSICVELGDTFSGGEGAGLARYADDRGNPDGMRDTTFSGGNTRTGGGTGWPMAKSLTLIPEMFRFSLVYGFNPLTGRQTERWRLRNVVRWVRPNPPVGALGDKFRPATSELMVFCKSAKRYFDLDSVRSSPEPSWTANGASSSRPAVRGELNGTLLTDDGSNVARWWCDFGKAEIPVVLPVARLTDDFEVVDLVGVQVRIKQAEREYVVDLQTVGGSAAPPALVAVAVERSLPGFLPVGAAIIDPSLSIGGAVLASPVGRTPDAVALKTAKVVAVYGRLITPDRLAARITLDVEGTLCAALLIAPVSTPPHIVEPTARVGQKLEMAGAPPLDWWDIPLLDGEEPTKGGPKNSNDKIIIRKSNKTPRQNLPDGTEDRTRGLPTMEVRTRFANEFGAPPLDWWEIPPGGYEGSHYAVFPPELCVRPVKAMSPERVCRVCGEPSRRMTEWTPEYAAARAAIVALPDPGGPGLGYDKRGGAIRVSNEQVTTGWTDCGHDNWRPGLVLDPFAGSGTTLLVATGHGRDAIGIDLDERNFDLALDRVGPFMLTLGNIDDK